MTSRLLGLAATLALVAAAPSAYAQTYTYVTIDPPGTNPASGAGVNGINAAGEIVGWYFGSNSNFHGFLYRDGTFTPIDVPGAIFTTAKSINDARDIVGCYSDNEGVLHGFLYSGGTYTNIDPPGSVSAELGECRVFPPGPLSNKGGSGQVMNASGQIIGTYTDSGGLQQHAFLYRHGTYTIIDPPGSLYNEIGNRTFPGAINDHGQIHRVVHIERGPFFSKRIPL
jgi:probable HAF family extracellular repeat protein